MSETAVLKGQSDKDQSDVPFSGDEYLGEIAPSQRTARIPPPNRLRLLLRVYRWLFAFARLAIWIWLDRSKHKFRAYRARRIVESMGGAAPVLVRQFAMRIELMPLDFATELSRLQDTAPPMPLDVALAQFRQHIHADIEEVFEVFDPEPILATSLDCVYQAVLRSGDKVAVRIMRPDAAQRIHAERLALELVLKVLGWIIPDYRARLTSVRDELPFIEWELLDFVKLARIHRLTEKELKRWKLKKKFHVARTYLELCTPNVIVSEFIEGYWLHEVLGAYENNDQEALATLAELNISPEKCGRRIFEFGLWSMLENVFTLAAPRAAQFAVLPGSKLVLVQIGTVTTLGRYQKRVYATILQRLLRRDFEGIADLLIQSVFPLPLIDVHEFTKSVQQRITMQLIALENKDAPSWQRSGAGLWLAFLEEVQGAGIVVPLELSRVIQSLCVFSELAFRLDLKASLPKRIRRYQVQAIRRGARDTVRKFQKPNSGGGSRFVSRPQELQETIERANLWIESSLENAPIQYLALSKKGAYSASQLIETIFLLSKITALWLAVKVGLAWHAQEAVNLFSMLWEIVSHPAYLLIIAAIFVVMARRVQFRLNDLDPDDD